MNTIDLMNRTFNINAKNNAARIFGLKAKN